MATIKDVASAAGVSVGTVSNVLNGKTNNAGLIERVEEAMEALGYRPDAKARSLKNTRSRMIGFIVPNIEQAELTALLSAAEERMEGLGYHLTVKISRNNRILERKCIEQLLMERADGIVLYPCGENESYLKETLRKEKTPLLFVGPDAEAYGGSYISIKYEKAFAKALEECRRRNERPAFILERGMIKKDVLEELYRHDFQGEAVIRQIDCSGEKGFHAAYTLLEQREDVGAIIAGNAPIARGTLRAARLCGKNIPVIAAKERSWIEDEEAYCAVIYADHRRAGRLAAEKIVKAAEETADPCREYIDADYKTTAELNTGIPAKKEGGKLALCLFDCPVTDAVKLMADIYSRRTGTQLEVKALPYDALNERLEQIGREKSAAEDILMADIVWMEDMARENRLLSLSGLPKGYADGFLDALVTEYGTFDGKLYGLPVMSGAMMLFYQKDLFEDVGLKRLYRRRYGRELLPPATWEAYNRVAEFFTREYNERSPIPYGITAIRGNNIYTTIGFLTRLWACGGDVFRGGRICINSESARRALKNFAESYRYVRKDKIIYNYNEAEREFMNGESAMIVSYDSHMVNVSDSSKSKVAGNIGCALIPGRKPVLGGWYMGINPYSERTKEALTFLQWLCGEGAAVPFSLLGGLSLRTDCIQREDMAAVYPWKKFLSETYEISRMRTCPGNRIKRGVWSACNHIIGGELERLLEEKQGMEEALVNMEASLKQL